MVYKICDMFNPANCLDTTRRRSRKSRWWRGDFHTYLALTTCPGTRPQQTLYTRHSYVSPPNAVYTSSTSPRDQYSWHRPGIRDLTHSGHTLNSTTLVGLSRDLAYDTPRGHHWCPSHRHILRPRSLWNRFPRGPLVHWFRRPDERTSYLIKKQARMNFIPPLFALIGALKSSFEIMDAAILAANRH